MPVLLPEERVGTTIAEKYRLDSILGRGGMGVVYAGHHEWTSRDVAVKILNPDLAQLGEAVHRFMQEARAAARLTTPHVVDVLDMGRQADGTVYMVLERLNGEPLAARIWRSGKLSIAETVAALAPVMEGLVEAHANGIVHRDIKPDNIYLATGPKGEVVPKLLDFGVAKVSQASKNTKTGTMLGTPHYMSPEQVRGDSSVGPAADIWSMGVLLYECLSGKLPYPGESTTGVLTSILINPPDALDEANPHLPEPLVELVHSTLQQNPEDRPASMAELLRRLSGLVDPMAVVDTLKPPPIEVDINGPTQLGQKVVTPIAEVAARPPSQKFNTAPFPLDQGANESFSALETPPPGVAAAMDTPPPGVAHGVDTPPPVASPAMNTPVAAPGQPHVPMEDAAVGVAVPSPPISRAPLLIAAGLLITLLGGLGGWLVLSSTATTPPDPPTTSAAPAIEETPPPPIPEGVETPDPAPVETAVVAPEPEPETPEEPAAVEAPTPRARRGSRRRRVQEPVARPFTGATSPRAADPTPPPRNPSTAPTVGANGAPILDI